ENRKPVRESIFIGLAMGASLLSRVLTVCLVPACAFAIIYRARRNALLPLIAFVGAMLLVCGWWYIRNWIYFGDPLLWHVYHTTLGKMWSREVSTLRIEDLLSVPAFLHASFWAYFGRNEFHAGIADYAIYLLLIALSVVGVIEIFTRRTKDPEFGQ